jgi:TonB-dependent receptor
VTSWLTWLLIGVATTQAQSGLIKGTVIDVETQSPLPGARVTIDSLKRGDISDVNGAFLLGNVPAGTHQLTVSYLGYQLETLSITLAGRETREVTIQLISEALLGEEVVITAQALGQTQAIQQQLSMDAIANVVSADRIQELPDVNAAEAIARLPGVAINRSGGEGQKVVIRGLEPKFAAITINGVNLPSNSGTDRSVDLSLIAPELLDGIEVFKSPMPDMDAEALGGTVNLKLRKAPKQTKLLVKGLGGYNALNQDARDYKGVLQTSTRILGDRLGVVFQGGIERFNRGGDIQTNTWRQGATDDSTGITEILGNSLRLENRQEIRRRYNSSLGLDYDLGRHQFAFFGLYSRTTRDQFIQREEYRPADQEINFFGRGIENSLDLTFLSLTGTHSLGPATVDWTLADTRSNGATPYDFTMGFFYNNDPFLNGLNNDGNPEGFLGAAQPDLSRTILENATLNRSETQERTQAATLNLELPFKLGKWLSGSLKVGGKYKAIDRTREVETMAENFYFLGANEALNAIAAYDGDLVFLPQNDRLVSIQSFTTPENKVDFLNGEGENVGLNASLDQGLIRDWADSQLDLLNEDRSALQDNYGVRETVSAGYAMLRLKLGKRLTLIPGFRYEYSDNVYTGGFSTLNGRYGVNGIFRDSSTTQRYGELLPHLHLIYRPTNWLDVRASYAKTLARPDFLFVTPRIQVDNNATILRAGNPDLNYAVSTNYDLSISAYKGGYGLISVGLFYKQINNLFYPWRTFLVNDSTAQAFGYPEYRGYELQSYINSPQSSVFGYEIDFQTTLSFLPGALAGLVFNINYSRLYSSTEVFFLTSERRLVIPVPPIFETIYNNSIREVNMPSQAPHILRASLGYDLKGFSARISAAYQGTKVNAYSVNRDFDTYNRDFWRVDASVKQRFGDHWSVFLNLNNLSNQQDISFTRDERFLNTIETYGLTGTLGVQFKL